MATGTYPITGIPVTPGTELPQRQEITKWASDPKNALELSLFIRALTKFKSLDIQQLTSYFQVAGIHCYPLVPWDGEAQVPQNPSDPFPGYCRHNLITFPTWHRPYMLLYEQVLYQLMADVIDEFKLSPDKAQPWISASKNFRLPYWDWALPQPYCKNFGVPYLCTTDTVDVVGKNGQLETVSNPLTGFSNPLTVNGKAVPMGDKAMGKLAIKDDTTVTPALPWSQCIGTSRYGIFSNVQPSGWINGVNNWIAVNSSMINPPWYGTSVAVGTFADAVTRMLMPGYFTQFDHFASTYRPKGVPNTDFLSLEYIHNVIHNVTGGQFLNRQQQQGNPPQAIGLGHMSDVPVAAFDPIFWLHHCNIDRLCAVWQTLNPGKWYTDGTTGQEPLLPFHYNKTQGRWTSDMCRDWTKLNYNYPELVIADSARNADGTVNSEAHISNVRAHIDALYDNTLKIVKDVPGYTSAEGDFNDYIINVIYDRYALNGRAYSILFFLGDPPAEIAAYHESDTYLGQVYTFSAPLEVDGQVACGNCAGQKDAQVLSKASIPLTQNLLRKLVTGAEAADHHILGVPAVEIGPLKPAPVEKVLEIGLQWVFVELGGRVLEHTSFPNTEIAVMHGKGHVRDLNDPRPRYTGYKQLRRATLNNFTGSGNSDNRLGLIEDDP